MVRRLRFTGLSFRLYGLTVLFALGLLVLGSGALWTRWNDGRASRIGRLNALTEVAVKIAELHRSMVKPGGVTEDEAKAQALAEVVALTYGKNDYFVVIDAATGRILAHPNPKQVGNNSKQSTDPTGFKFIADVLPRTARDGVAAVEYQYPRLGSDVPSLKISVYRLHAPWNWAIGTGAYVDDLRSEYWNAVLTLGGTALAVLAVLAAASTLVVRSVTRPAVAIADAMRALAGGNNETVIPDGGTLTETRSMADSVRVFKDAAVKKAHAEQQARDIQGQAEKERAHQEVLTARLAAQQVAVVDALAGGLDRLSAGDLTVRLNEAFAPEYERLRSDFNRTVDKLATTIGAIVGSTSAIRTGTGEITSAADDLSRRTEQQAASLEQTAAALEEITATVRKTADSAHQARQIVTVSQTGAKQSGQIVQDAVSAMTNIEKSATEISQIIGVIDEIAFQTNLLALNAGVEAARAGDAGRGFAVVASEVRALAQRSAQAAKEIKALISTSTQQVGEGVKLVDATGRSLSQIIAEVDQINIVVLEIAAGAQEQASGLNQVSTAVNHMDQITQQNAAMVEQSTAASHGLAQEISELDRLTAFFQTDVKQPRQAAPAVAALGGRRRAAA